MTLFQATRSGGRGSARARILALSRCVALTTTLVALILPSLPAAGQGSQSKAPDAEQKGDENKAGQKDARERVSAPLPKGKKLILKDGSYQLAKEYERKGDRVRYYSVERSAWEEIPTDLVDWEATRKVEAEEAQRDQAMMERVRAAKAAERAADIDVGLSIEVAPGLFLPDNEGLYVVEGREIVPLEQSNTDIKLDKKRLLTQVLVPIPVVPTRHKIQIPGKHSARRLTVKQPEFYIRTAEAREPEMELIHAEVKGDARLLEFLSTQITGQKTSKRKAISIERWQVARGVYRYTLSQPLEPGEYAMAEILPDGMNLYVWDFGVDGSAGAPQNQPQRPQKQSAPQKQSTAKPKS